MSLSEFARLMKVSPSAARRAVTTGRLRQSVAQQNGRPVIIDVALAKQEWRLNAAKRPRGSASATLVEAQRRQIEEKIRGLTLTNDLKAGRLIPVAEAEMVWSRIIVNARNAMLGLPTRAKQRLPHLTRGDAVVLDALVREALTELADSAKAGEKERA